MRRRARALAFALAAGTVGAQEFTPSADWSQRDLEGKWVAYRGDLEARAQDAGRQRAWIAWLAAREEHDLLEWIGTYEGWHVAGAQLEQLDSPGWMRVAVWNLGSTDSHSLDNGRKALARAAARVNGWAARFPAVRGEDPGLFAELAASAAVEAEPRQLPPLDEAAVLWAWLDVPSDVAELGDDPRARPGVRYVHQVVRALRGVRHRAARVGPYLDKLVRLVQHEHATIGAEAAAALGRLPAASIPVEPLRRVASGDDPARVRRLATLALSFSSHPSVFFWLHEVAGDDLHPGHDAAAQRLGDVGDGYTLALAARGKLPLAADAQRRIGERLASGDADAVRQRMQLALARAAWARVNGHAAAALACDTFVAAARRARDRVPDAAIAGWDAGAQREAVERAMRELLREVGDGK